MTNKSRALMVLVLAALLSVGCGKFMKKKGSGGAGSESSGGSSSSALEEQDMSAALKVKIAALQTAVGTGDSKKVEGPLLDLAILPSKAEVWFKDTYGPT